MKMFKSIGVFAIGLLLAQVTSIESAAENFSKIASVNVFRLNPAQPEPRPPAILAERPKVSLQGLATLLGAQALLKIQTNPHPSVTDISCVLGEGQSRDGVEVLRIDMKSETVWVKNQGEPQMLTLGR